MPETIRWSLQVRVADGPQVATAGTLTVEAYDKISVEIPPGTDQQVDLVPSAGGSVRLVLIVPGTPSADLTYDVGGTDIALDSTHVFLGAGAAQLLGDDPASLTFTNGGSDPAVLDILLGRDATP